MGSKRGGGEAQQHGRSQAVAQLPVKSRMAFRELVSNVIAVARCCDNNAKGVRHENQNRHRSEFTRKT